PFFAFPPNSTSARSRRLRSSSSSARRFLTSSCASSRTCVVLGICCVLSTPCTRHESAVRATSVAQSQSAVTAHSRSASHIDNRLDSHSVGISNGSLALALRCDANDVPGDAQSLHRGDDQGRGVDLPSA